MKLASVGKSQGTLLQACHGKQPFETFDAAARIVRRQRGKIKVKAGTLQIYKCQYCQHWHMGGGNGKSRN